MKNYKKINNILGWLVFVVASTVYILTSEPTMSFWDCGEYISTAYKLEVGHPPGAPLFQMIGKFFTLFAFGDIKQVARMINTMSALCSGLTILFLFWTITMIAKKIMLRNGEQMTTANLYAIMGAGLVGSLAYTFSDSFWFSAVEGEVYAMSSFFTAVVFWSIFKWEEHAGEKHAYRWLLLISFLVGLSIGVHLLNLLAIPAITFVYYFKKYPNPNLKGILVTLIISFLLLSTVMFLIIPWIIKMAGLSELLFVNSFGLPFNSGTIVYFVILIGLIVLGLHYTRKNGRPLLNTIILAFTFILIGYTSFLMLVIRSNADTPLDENNPENAMYLLAYLNREQYGDWPLLKGQYFNAPVIDRGDGNPVYTKDTKTHKYLITDKKEKSIPVYDPRFTTIFPRMWANMEKKYAVDYKRWAGIKGVPIDVQSEGKTETHYLPTFSENLRFFWRFQVVHMYWRYFMWNFAGKQNDTQGFGDKLEGNWKSGIPFVDKARLGPQNIPGFLKSKGDNRFYFLPLILGLIGLVYTIRKDYKSTLVIALLFFMTGLAIVLYLNQYSPQPRERDYAYAGSFYAYAIWIGLGVIALIHMLPAIVNKKLSAILITVLCLILVPGIMGQQGWDDHDRSGRYTSLAIAENYLNSCPLNAILFTNGDNDTFPLWYAQEVENIRTDVRVVNLSLLNTDWFINQMKRKAYLSDPVPFSLTEEKYRQGNHDLTYILDQGSLKDTYVDLKDLFNLIRTDESKLKYNTGSIGMIDYFPTSKFMVTVDSEKVIRNGYIPSRYAGRLETIRWEYKPRVIEKNSLMILDLLATNDWKRPVCFSAIMGTDVFIGLDKYLHLEGLAYRLLPVRAKPSEDGQPGEVNTEIMYDNMMNKFKWGNINDPGIYLDEQNIRMIMNFRNTFGRLANALIHEGKKDSARRVLDRCIEVMPPELVPFNYFILPVAEGYYQTGDEKKANQIAEKLYLQSRLKLEYMNSFPESDLRSFDMSFQEDLLTLQQVSKMTGKYNQNDLSEKAEEVFQKYYKVYLDKIYQQ